MTTSAVKSNLGIIVAVGSVWGMTEFAAGMLYPDHHTDQDHLILH